MMNNCWRKKSDRQLTEYNNNNNNNFTDYCNKKNYSSWFSLSYPIYFFFSLAFFYLTCNSFVFFESSITYNLFCSRIVHHKSCVCKTSLNTRMRLTIFPLQCQYRESNRYGNLGLVVDSFSIELKKHLLFSDARLLLLFWFGTRSVQMRLQLEAVDEIHR